MTTEPGEERRIDITTEPWRMGDDDRILLDGEEHTVYRDRPKKSGVILQKAQEARRMKDPDATGPKYAHQWSLLTGSLRVISENLEEFSYIHFTEEPENPIVGIETVELLEPSDE